MFFHAFLDPWGGLPWRGRLLECFHLCLRSWCHTCIWLTMLSLLIISRPVIVPPKMILCGKFREWRKWGVPGFLEGFICVALLWLFQTEIVSNCFYVWKKIAISLLNPPLSTAMCRNTCAHMDIISALPNPGNRQGLQPPQRAVKCIEKLHPFVSSGFFTFLCVFVFVFTCGRRDR